MSWFRWWAGTVNDPKWRIIAARANCRPGDCLAVWAYLLEIAKDGDGDISKADPEECAVVLGYDHLLVETIIAAMRDKGLIADGRLTAWEKNKSGRIDDFRLTAEWRALREVIFARDDYTCAYCGERGGCLQCDHIIPVSRGGANDPENLTTACSYCNQSKRDKLLSEWTR